MPETKYSCAQDILCGVNMPKDPKALSELEQKHVPVISAPDKVKRDEIFSVTVEVGKLKTHPNEPAHLIEWVELYCGDTFLARTSLAGSLSQPKITIPVKLTHAHDFLKARAKCNIHGLWEYTKPLGVE